MASSRSSVTPEGSALQPEAARYTRPQFRKRLVSPDCFGRFGYPRVGCINPANTIDVSLVYDMPAAAVPARIELHDSMFSGGVTVDLTP